MWSATNRDERSNYLRYGDVFMTSQQQRIRRPVNSIRTQTRADNPNIRPANRVRTVKEMFANAQVYEGDVNETEYMNRSATMQFDEDDYQLRNSDGLEQSRFNKSITEDDMQDYIVPNRNIHFKKRQLPQLQRYRDNSRDEERYWNDYSEYEQAPRKSRYQLLFPAVWQKFVITFTTLLSLICLTWIAYNWRSTKVDNEVSVINPERPFFKVLPDAPGGMEIPYQDKLVYNRIDPAVQLNPREDIVPSTEEPGDLPISNERISIANYTIIDDRDYYVKCHKDKDVTIAQKQLSLIRRKLLMYQDQSVLSNVSSSVRRVANAQGQLGEYILIGPFPNDIIARNIGRFCQVKGEIISVLKKAPQ